MAAVNDDMLLETAAHSQPVCVSKSSEGPYPTKLITPAMRARPREVGAKSASMKAKHDHCSACRKSDIIISGAVHTTQQHGRH